MSRFKAYLTIFAVIAALLVLLCSGCNVFDIIRTRSIHDQDALPDPGYGDETGESAFLQEDPFETRSNEGAGIVVFEQDDSLYEDPFFETGVPEITGDTPPTIPQGPAGGDESGTTATGGTSPASTGTTATGGSGSVTGSAGSGTTGTTGGGTTRSGSGIGTGDDRPWYDIPGNTGSTGRDWTDMPGGDSGNWYDIPGSSGSGRDWTDVPGGRDSSWWDF